MIDLIFFGAQVESGDDGNMTMLQNYYAKTLKQSRKDGTFGDFRSEPELFSWITSTILDVACIANKAAQVTEKNMDRTELKTSIEELGKL